MPAPGSSPAAPALAAKNTGERAAPPGFVWDHNLNRFIPAAGTVKAVPTPAPQAKEQPPAVPKPPSVTRAPKPTDLTRSLQPGESFVLFVGLSGKPAGPGGTLSVEGPGQSTVEPLIVVEAGLHARVAAKPPASPLPAAVQTPPPAAAPVAGAALPVPSLHPLHRQQWPPCRLPFPVFSQKKPRAQSRRRPRPLRSCNKHFFQGSFCRASASRM